VNIVIHTNLGLANQRESGAWLQQGFRRHGIAAEITPDKHKAADVHVIMGNWYAYNEWLPKSSTSRVIYLNRCFYGSPRFDLSLGWLRPDGSRDFRNHGATEGKGVLPVLKPQKTSRRCVVVFADYGQDPSDMVMDARARFDSVFFRPHPAQNRETPVMTLKGDLETVWEIADVAIGHGSTVLCDAVIAGLHVESTDPGHVVQDCEERQAWLNRLSWAQWSHTELINGDFWSHLCVQAD